MSPNNMANDNQESNGEGEIAITVDLEEWYHGLTRTNVHPETWQGLPARAKEIVPILLDIFSEADVKATFFVLGDLAQNSPGVIRLIADLGHEIASHGYSHRPVYKLTTASFRTELQNTKKLIQDITGQEIWGFRAPYFSINQTNLWALDVIAEEGYIYDSSIFPLKTILYGYPGAPRHPHQPISGNKLIEYPVSTIRYAGITIPIAGGFYNRMLPYSFLKRALQQVNHQGFPGILYFHPWELDVNQPRIPVSLRERLTHFGGRKTLGRKLRRLVTDFKLKPLIKVHQQWIAKQKV